MAVTAGVTEKDPDLRIFNPPGRPGIRALHTSRLDALLEKTSFIQNQNSLSGPYPAQLAVPALIAQAKERAEKRFFAFSTANIRNPNTWRAYGRAMADFCAWCDRCEITLPQIEPILVATYLETISRRLSAPSVKLYLAAIRMLFDWLVVGQILSMNPAAALRAPSMWSNAARPPCSRPKKPGHYWTASQAIASAG
jgi:hypothetical protein